MKDVHVTEIFDSGTLAQRRSTTTTTIIKVFKEHRGKAGNTTA